MNKKCQYIYYSMRQFSRPYSQDTRTSNAEKHLLSFQLKCSSNIDSIHYLGLTNSYEFKFFLTSCAFPIGQSVLKRNLIGSFKSNRKLINFLSNELVRSGRGNALNQYLRNTSIGTTVINAMSHRTM
jgi:hypothetical protein